MFDREEYREAAARAIRLLLRQVWWKPQKGGLHLAKCKTLGHLRSDATMDEYNAIISELLRDANSLVYHYAFGIREYYAVSGEVERAWLVIFSPDGIVETAFPPENLADYLTMRDFVLLGRMKEILHE